MHKILRESSISVRKALVSSNIKTVASLISCDSEKVAQHVTSLEKEELYSVQKDVIGQYSCFPVNGSDLLNDVVSSFFILSTGCDHWDELLDGGLYSGEVSEIVGCAGAGKTQVCMSIAASIAMNTEKNVLYVDTQGAFSSDRIKQMLDSRDSTLTGQDVINILSRVKCIQAFDIYELINCLIDTKDSLYNENQGFYSHLRLVIVDSVASFITPILGGQQINGHAMMVHLSRILKSLALQNGLSVMVTNNVVSDSSSFDTRRVKPALGQTWSHMANTRIFIQKGSWSVNTNGQAAERIATVTKSSRQPTQISTTFFIQSAGIQDLL